MQKTPGERLKIVIKSLSLTQQEVADRFGIDRSLLSVLCNDKQKISSLMLYALKSEFNVNPTWLLTGEGEMFLPSVLRQAQHSAPLRDREIKASPAGEGEKDSTHVRTDVQQVHNNGFSVTAGEAPDVSVCQNIDDVARTPWFKSLHPTVQKSILAMAEISDEAVREHIAKVAESQVTVERSIAGDRFSGELKKKGEAG